MDEDDAGTLNPNVTQPPSGGPPPPTRRQGPPPWFFVAIGLAVVIAAVLVLVRTGGDDTPPIAAPPVVEATTQPAPASTAAPAPLVTEPPIVSSSPSPATIATPTVVLGASCAYDSEGYGIDYPAGWFTPRSPAWVCQLFDPRPFTVEPNIEPPNVAVVVYAEHYRLGRILAALTDPTLYKVISSEQGTFADAGRPGTILETVQTAEGLWPRGTRTFAVLVDRLDTTIVVSTNDLADSDYAQNKQIVLAMAESLRIAG